MVLRGSLSVWERKGEGPSCRLTMHHRRSGTLQGRGWNDSSGSAPPRGRVVCVVPIGFGCLRVRYWVCLEVSTSKMIVIVM